MSIHHSSSSTASDPIEIFVPDTKTGDPVKVIDGGDSAKPKKSIVLHNVWGANQQLEQEGSEPFPIPVTAEETYKTKLVRRLVTFGKKLGLTS